VPNTEVLDRWLDTSNRTTAYCVRLRRPDGEERDHCGEGDHFRICYEAAEVGKQAPVGCVA
jgi:hypothetical protein